MKQYQFKTNIKCGGCISTVTPHLEKVSAIKDWKVDIQNPDKVLTVQTDNLEANEIQEIIQKAGFKAEKL